MKYSVYDMRQFYGRRLGRLVRRLLQSHIREFCSEASGLRVMGFGYTTPYMNAFIKDSERCFCVMPSVTGVHQWPEGQDNLTCLSSADQLPLETESIDRIVVVHGLEYAEHPDVLMQELWRVLKSNGRIFMIVPNRLGFWSRTDWTPFGHGSPYTAGQLHNLLRQAHFLPEAQGHALFMPPFKSFSVLRLIYFFEILGKLLFPGLAGVHVIEATKQIYSGIPVRKTVKAGKRRIIVAGADTAPV